MHETHHSLTTYIASRFLVKGRIRVVLVALFCCSLLFLSYQFINYSNLTSYQSQEFQKRSGVKVGNRGGAAANYHSLKDIALKFEIEKERHPHPGGGGDGNQIAQPATKGDTGPLFETKSQQSQRGKPIFSKHVLGVALGAQKHYTKLLNKEYFSCLTSGKKITWDKVNDDFCDCPSDGSDEPSTAACMNGRFICSDFKEGFPEYIPSSMVNDGICDCLGGEDEHLKMNSISCKNRA